MHALFEGILPSWLAGYKSAQGANSRRRIYTPLVTFWAFLAQTLDADGSCRRAVARVQALCAALSLRLPDGDTGAYCLARARLPMRLLLRLHAHIAGTLRDARLYHAVQIAAWYQRRWQVELYFDDIKTSLNMHALRCKSPHMVARELLMHMIAYNLVRHLMAQAEPRRDLAAQGALSFKGAMDRLAQWQWSIWNAPNGKQAALRRAALLQTIADDEVPQRPGRKEPRVCKDRQNKYTFMTKPRHLYTLQDDIAHASQTPLNSVPFHPDPVSTVSTKK